MDFGTADVYWQTQDASPVTVKYLTVSFPFSNAGVVQLWQVQNPLTVLDVR